MRCSSSCSWRKAGNLERFRAGWTWGAVPRSRHTVPSRNNDLGRSRRESHPSTPHSSNAVATYYETATHIFVHANYDPVCRWTNSRLSSCAGNRSAISLPGPHVSGRTVDRRTYVAEERRGPQPGPPGLHRHLLLRRRLADGARCPRRRALASRIAGDDPFATIGVGSRLRPPLIHNRSTTAKRGHPVIQRPRTTEER